MSVHHLLPFSRSLLPSPAASFTMSLSQVKQKRKRKGP
uniref:Uncharacterized protein n=1 Tax=Arundo donax TaxID=35708 RepID=A0A0A9EWY8_ARUDO